MPTTTRTRGTAAPKSATPKAKAATPRKAATPKKTVTFEPKAAEAAKKAGRAAAKKAAPKPKTAPKPKADPRDPSLVEAVRYARHDLHGKNPKLAEGKRPAASSIGDHAAVRAAITKHLGKPTPTVKEILGAVGVKSAADLERAARFEDTPDVLAALRSADVMKQVAADAGGNRGWRTGRYASGILAAWAREIGPKPRAKKA